MSEKTSRLLDEINSPGDLKRLNIRQLPLLAGEIRSQIIETVEKTGGHLASNLGVVDLTLALHYVFDFSEDRLVWDVGHQCYAHKLLTGRKERFGTLRQYRGLCGYPDKNESAYDPFNSGHAGTSISTALGLACGKSSQDRHVVAVVGDGALATGMAFEAMNHAGALKKNLLVILNDNKMSISPSVGALADYFNRIRQSMIFGQARRELKAVLEKIPLIGDKMRKSIHSLQEIVAKGLVPGYFFEELGFQYFGPENGHKIKPLIKTLREIKDREGPKLLHVLTQKGRGHGLASRHPARYHSHKAAEPVGTEVGKITREFHRQGQRSYTKIFSDTLIRLAAGNERITAITAAMPDGTGLDRFAEKYPDRYYDVGICEQHAVGLACGLSEAGMKPVIAIYSTFLQRAYDQLFHELCLQEADVTLAIDRAGIVGGDGATHQGIFDIAYLRHLPGTVLMAACDAGETEKMLDFAIRTHGIVALRYPRAACPEKSMEHCQGTVSMGKGVLLREGGDGAIIAYGSMVYPALEAARLLAEEGVDAAVVNARFAKPLDEALLLGLAEEQPFLLTVEDHVLSGGFGSAVTEMLADKQVLNTPVFRMGVHKGLIEHGSRCEILKTIGLGPQGICSRFREAAASAHERTGGIRYRTENEQ